MKFTIYVTTAEVFFNPDFFTVRRDKLLWYSGEFCVSPGIKSIVDVKEINTKQSTKYTHTGWLGGYFIE